MKKIDISWECFANKKWGASGRFSQTVKKKLFHGDVLCDNMLVGSTYSMLFFNYCVRIRESMEKYISMTIAGREDSVVKLWLWRQQNHRTFGASNHDVSSVFSLQIVDV